MSFRSVQFLTSAAQFAQCPPPSVPEVAFFGRSNVGKSSLINTLAQRKSLAKASATPGKTRLINFFLIKQHYADQEIARQIVDLPGYGYAKAGEKEKKKRLDTTQTFLTRRPTLQRLFLLIDASIPPQKIDLQMIATLLEAKIPLTLIATKIDKSTQKERAKHLQSLQLQLKHISPKPLEILLVSNVNGKGREEILQYILQHCLLPTLPTA